MPDPDSSATTKRLARVPAHPGPHPGPGAGPHPGPSAGPGAPGLAPETWARQSTRPASSPKAPRRPTHPGEPPGAPPATAGPNPCAAILLAAGASTRLGQPKQLLLYQGETLLRRAAALALSAGCTPVLVIVPAATTIAAVTATDTESSSRPATPAHPSSTYTQALAGLPVTLIPNPQAATGMGSSLRLGIAALASLHPQPGRVLLMVCDQPLLRPAHLAALFAAQAASPGGIAAASYPPTPHDAPRPGVPAVFSRAHFPALAAAAGDQGARSLLRSHPVTIVPIPEAAIDIDIPEDLRALET